LSVKATIRTRKNTKKKVTPKESRDNFKKINSKKTQIVMKTSLWDQQRIEV